MTVRDLIAALQEKNPEHRVVVMLDSPHDVWPITDVATMVGDLGPVYLRADAAGGTTI